MISSIGVSSSILVEAQEVLEGRQAIQSSGTNDILVEPFNQNFHIETLLTIFLIGLLVYLAISLVKYFLDHRLKNKLVDKGGAEYLSSLIQESNGISKNDDAIRSAILFCGLGVGLMITYFTLPIHIHSLAIMAFSIGLSYLGYFFYLKNRNK